MGQGLFYITVIFEGSPFGKGKGKSGKSKKGTAYFVDYDGEAWCPEVYVLSLAEDESSDDLATSKAIVDAGATESVAGIRCMSWLIDAAGIPYQIELNDRPRLPRLRFGDGECQRAVSKIHLSTPALGRVSFYLLDGGAERTPMLLGSRDLCGRPWCPTTASTWPIEVRSLATGGRTP